MSAFCVTFLCFFFAKSTYPFSVNYPGAAALGELAKNESPATGAGLFLGRRDVSCETFSSCALGQPVAGRCCTAGIA